MRNKFVFFFCDIDPRAPMRVWVGMRVLSTYLHIGIDTQSSCFVSACVPAIVLTRSSFRLCKHSFSQCRACRSSTISNRSVLCGKLRNGNVQLAFLDDDDDDDDGTKSPSPRNEIAESLFYELSSSSSSSTFIYSAPAPDLVGFKVN
jgi:hypothetical protein